MGNMHIVTGYKGQSHVSAADAGSLNAAIFGTGQYVLDRGEKLAALVVSNNKIRISDGDIMMQGRHVRLNEGSYVDLSIDNGQVGLKRNDLVVARYTKDSNTGIEDVNLVVIKGTASSEPEDPGYTSGDIINDHVNLSDFPLYRIQLDGLNVGTPVPLFVTSSGVVPDGSVTIEKLEPGLALTLEEMEASSGNLDNKLAKASAVLDRIKAGTFTANINVGATNSQTIVETFDFGGRTPVAVIVMTHSATNLQANTTFNFVPNGFSFRVYNVSSSTVKITDCPFQYIAVF